MANPLESYFSDVQDFTGFDPAIVPGAVDDVLAVVRDRNDPSAWLAFGGTVVRQIWSAMPPDVRGEILGALDDVIQNALSGATSGVIDSMGSEVSEAVPIVGQAIGAAIKILGMAVQAGKVVSSENRAFSDSDKREQMVATIKDYANPRYWVFRSMKVRNYPKYVKIRGGGDWSEEPAFGRRSGETDTMFVAEGGREDVGRCGKDDGVSYSCPTFRAEPWEDCERKPKGSKSNPDNPCERWIGISSLFYPYWSPAYPAAPIELDGKGADVNAILAEQQMAILVSPAVNLRVGGEFVRDVFDRFVWSWQFQSGQLKSGGKPGLVPIDAEGSAVQTSPDDAYLVDPVQDPDYDFSQSNRARFYLSGDGRIFPYSGMADPERWGVFALGGVGIGGAGKTIGVSVAAYNAVISGVLGFFTARQAMLRNGARMKGLLKDTSLVVFDPHVRQAMKYAASIGTMIPPETRAAGSRRPARARRARRAPARARPPDRGGSGGGAGALPVLLGLGSFYLALKR